MAERERKQKPAPKAREAETAEVDAPGQAGREDQGGARRAPRRDRLGPRGERGGVRPQLRPKRRTVSRRRSRRPGAGPRAVVGSPAHDRPSTPDRSRPGPTRAPPSPSCSGASRPGRAAPAPTSPWPGRRRPPIEVPHGTTIVSCATPSGVVMAGDRRATEGHTIASRRMDKVSRPTTGRRWPSPARPGRPWRWSASSRPSSSTTRRSRASRCRSRARPTSSPR